jgi:phosphopantetheinyl transferase (holo-ACP synthase)
MIITLVESLSIENIRAEQEKILVECLLGSEREKLIGRPLQSLAGCLALKQALCGLLDRCFALKSAAGEIGLDWTGNGAPQVILLPREALSRGLLVDNLHVSISHTRQFAYGMVSYQGPHYE